MTRILVIDNYDSFVYNLVQYVGQLGAEPLVRRHDALLEPDRHLRENGGRRQVLPEGQHVHHGHAVPERHLLLQW